MSGSEVISDFIAFMCSEGVEPANASDIYADITSGKVIRFDCVGERKNSKNGWAKLYLDDRPAGAFGNWKLGINRRWSSGTANEFSAEERQALRQEWEANKARREALEREAHEGAGRDAIHIWSNAKPALSTHPYIERKRLDPAPLRQSGDNLLIPMFDHEGRLWNVQRIFPDGTKRFLKDGRIDGLFALIGAIGPERKAVLGEGYATLDAVHQASGTPCIVAFNTANLPKVARIWAGLRPDIEFTVFADDDAATELQNIERRGVAENPGIKAAEAVAQEIGARIAYPSSRRAA